MRKPSFIKSFRVAAALTQNDVAKALQISPASYARFENGDAVMPADKLKALAMLLHTTPEALNDKDAAARYQSFVQKVWRSSNAKTSERTPFTLRK